MIGLVRKVVRKVGQKGLWHCGRAALGRLADRARRLRNRARRHARLAYYHARAFLIINYWHTRRRLLENFRITCIRAREACQWPFVFALRVAGVRFLDVMLNRIGHLAIEVNCYVTEGLLGKRPRQVGVILVPPQSRVANPCLLDYWRKYVWVVRSPALYRLLLPFTAQKRLLHPTWDYVIAMNRTSRSPALHAEWAGRPPLLRLTEAHRRRGEARLRELGVPDGAW